MLSVRSAEVPCQWRYRFGPTSLFPSISFNQILEYEFQLAFHMRIPIEFDNKEFFEFIWHIERMIDQREIDNRDKGNDNESMLSQLGG